MKRMLFKVLLILGVIGMIFSACAAPAAAPTGGDGDAAMDDSGEMASGGTITWVGHQEVSSLSPNDYAPTVHWVMISNIHDPLVYFNENYEFEPRLATEWEVAEDGLTYTFTLREGVTFHDGSDFTAEDVKYTFEFYSDPDNGSLIANDLKGMGSVETPDDYTVVVNMDEVNAAFLLNAGGTFIVPSDYHAEIGEEAYTAAPIGTGPFMLSEWVPAEFTELVKFDDYFLGEPLVDILRQETVPEPSVRAIALETGDADSATWPLLVEDSLRLRDEEEGFTVFSTPADSVKHFPINNTLPQLSDKRVRQALLMALDRQRIIDDLWNGAAVVAQSNLTPATSYQNANVKTYDYDPEGAMALLEEAGWTDSNGDGVRENADGDPLTFTCTTITGDQARRPIAELAQQFWKEVGIDVKLEEAPVAAILAAMREGEMDCSLFNWTYGTARDPDGSATLRSDGANNFSQFKNDRVDELLDAGLATSDPAERAVFYNEIQEIVTEEVPFIYLQYDDWLNVHSPNTKGLPDPDSTVAGSRLYPQGHIFGSGERG